MYSINVTEMEESMITKEYVGILHGQKRRLCVKQCDNCSREEICRADTVKLSHSNGRKLDLCKRCRGSRKFKKSPRGRDNKNFKHGLHMSGYRLVTVDDGRKCFEHTYLYEKHLKRRLKKEERIHHIDLDKLNNDIDNLHLCEDRASHRLCHSSLETLGFSLLGNIIWFDREEKSYSLLPQNSFLVIHFKNLLP